METNENEVVGYEGYYTLAPLTTKGEVFKYCCDNNYNNILDKAISAQDLLEKLEQLWQDDKDTLLELCNNYDYAITDDLDFAYSQTFKEIVDETAEFDVELYKNVL